MYLPTGELVAEARLFEHAIRRIGEPDSLCVIGHHKQSLRLDPSIISNDRLLVDLGAQKGQLGVNCGLIAGH